jgi:hypothetical protein
MYKILLYISHITSIDEDDVTYETI